MSGADWLVLWKAGEPLFLFCLLFAAFLTYHVHRR